MLLQFRAFGHIEFLGIYFDFRIFSDTAHEQHDSKKKAYLDCNRKVENDRQEESHKQDGYVALRSTEYTYYRTPSAHVVRNHHKHRREAGKRHIVYKRHKEEEDQQQHERMDNTATGVRPRW